MPYDNDGEKRVPIGRKPGTAPAAPVGFREKLREDVERRAAEEQRPNEANDRESLPEPPPQNHAEAPAVTREMPSLEERVTALEMARLSPTETETSGQSRKRPK
jgi:hypothetical protein